MQFNIEPSHLISFVSGMGAAWAAFKAIARFTETSRDDAVVEKVEAFAARQRELILRYAPALFTVVEVASKTGALPAGTDKWVTLLSQLKTKIKAETGADMTPTSQELAKQIVDRLASDHKEVR